MISHSKPTLTKLDFAQINECLTKGNIASGSVATDFEERLKSIFNAQDCIVTNSGTSAIFLALKAIGITKAEQEILLPSYVCESVLHAINLSGGSAIFYDNGSDWIATNASITKKVTSKTAAIIVVHTLGIVMTEIKELLHLQIPIIEDCCQCFGAELKGKKVGTFGDISVFSFHATKCLTTGEGGAVVVNNPAYVDQLRKEYCSKLGLFNFSNLQASLGISQLSQYADFLTRRNEIANIYFSVIQEKFTNAFHKYYDNSIKYRFLLQYKNNNFEKLKDDFGKVGIAVRKGVDELLHRKNKLPDSDFPKATSDFNNTISIPIYPTISREEAFFISHQVNNILL